MTGTLTLPVWLIPVLVTLGLATITALWRTAAELSDATRRLLAMEAKIAAIATLETAAAVIRTQVDELRAAVETLRARSHTQASEIATLRAHHDALASRVGHIDDDVRRSSHPRS